MFSLEAWMLLSLCLLAAQALAGPPTAQVIFVVDATHSWQEGEMVGVRVALLDALRELYVRDDFEIEVGMVVFGNLYGFEWSELTLLDGAGYAALDAQWSGLSRLSNAGVDLDRNDGRDCQRFGSRTATYAERNNFLLSECYPGMPRKYWDETGTTHGPALRMAGQMFAHAAPADFRATVMITDGTATSMPADVGMDRAADGYISPFRMARAVPGRTTFQYQAEAASLSDRLWRDMRVHQWVFSYQHYGPDLSELAQGMGEAQWVNSLSGLRTIGDLVAQP